MENHEQSQPIEQAEEQQPTGPQLNQEKFNAYIASLKIQQNFPKGFITGLVAALIGAALWAVITIATEYQIGFMAVGVGLLVGFTIRSAGNGIDQKFGILGASLSLFGCLLGNYITVIGMIGKYSGLGFMDTFSTLGFGGVFSVMGETFEAVDILFYGIAVYEGYKFSFRRISQDEIVQNSTI